MSNTGYTMALTVELPEGVSATFTGSLDEVAGGIAVFFDLDEEALNQPVASMVVRAAQTARATAKLVAEFDATEVAPEPVQDSLLGGVNSLYEAVEKATGKKSLDALWRSNAEAFKSDKGLASAWKVKARALQSQAQPLR
ncbi:hypothetical protein [Salininema proteolyticum]|uniref:Uncharacterized protein n=1 Tax=Salininema proteolyticum TaxID=1607685 RepID=A0ABV8TZP5_9ACTN